MTAVLTTVGPWVDHALDQLSRLGHRKVVVNKGRAKRIACARLASDAGHNAESVAGNDEYTEAEQVMIGNALDELRAELERRAGDER